ncbi:plasma membrane heat shock protein [Scheffersomyces coipomensis]|uniref:plasma membrane heat shock protein n=1 Tax=Scheffersomyces coipomensis TaxID=1788519 RepID=UPI00315CC8B8
MAYISDLIKKNNVLNLNPPNDVSIHITQHGSDWLWTCFAIYSLSILVHVGFFFLTKRKTQVFKRTLLGFPIYIHAVLAFAYFTMASNLGYAPMTTEFNHADINNDMVVGDDIRQLFYARYIAWFVAWPMVLTTIELSNHIVDFNTADTDLFTKIFSFAGNLFLKIIGTELFVIGYLVGMFIHSTYKWGYFVFGTVGLLFSAYLVGYNTFINTIGDLRAGRLQAGVIGFYLITWILYPIAWGLSEGGNYIQPDSEAVFYGILDLVVFLVVPTALSWGLIRDVNEEFFKNVVGYDMRTDQEKIIETPRHSGDTAVPPMGVPTTEEA